jgi:hypothetical protein
VSVEEIEDTLSMLERRVGALGTYEEPPKTLLRVIGESQTEKAWHLQLAYFVDVTEPHGFGTDVLEQFLQCVSEHPEMTFEFQPHQLEDINTEVEVAADDGRPDLVLWVEDDWFVCVEIKVSSSESDNQTERYAASDQLGDLDVTTIPEEQQHYVYLADRRSANASAESFVNLSWEVVIESMERLRSGRLATYPARSGAQLSEFIDHIKHELQMTNESEEYYKKAALALEYQDLLDELDNSVERVVADLQASWESDFRKDPPKGWTDEWVTVKYGNNYGRLLKENWVLPSNSTGKPKKTNGFSIAFPTEILESNIRNGKTHFKFRVYGDNEYSEEYQDRFYGDEFQQQIAPIIDKHGITLEPREGKSRLLKTPYSFEFDNGDGYLDALKRGFEQHLELVPHLERIYFDIRSEIDNEECLFE